MGTGNNLHYLLDNEEDSLKQFFICELKFFRKVVAALDRYLIPAQANQLLTPQEIHLIFAHIITVITMTKRILQCVANGASKTGWRLGEILFSTHSDHISEITSAYTAYAKNLGNSSLILGEKMTLQNFARFVLETPVPKGHLDMTSLLFAPLEHLRNLCEICDEIVHHFEHWTEFATQLKDCYANIVVHTDFMEPISHISMKKHPLLSVRDLEKRIVSTSCQPMKVNEKGRKWLFGSRLFRKENDGSWAPVWAFLFTDIIVLTSHMTRDRVFFVKEAPIRLEDVSTLHFNLAKKNENEFRLLFGPEPSQTSYGRFERMLPLHRRQKRSQIVLRTTNLELKAMWKLLLQRQIITLNTRLSKSSSSNFSISEFCEKFPDNETARATQSRPHEEKIDEEPEEEIEDNERPALTNPAALTVSSICSYMKTTSNTGRPLATNYNYSPSTPTAATPSIERKELKMDSVGKDTGSPLYNKAKPSPAATGREFRKEFNSPAKIVEEAEEEERSATERRKSVAKTTGEKIIEAAAAAALEVANMTAGTSKSPSNTNSIIKHPQSRTIHVPDHKPLVGRADAGEKVLSALPPSSVNDEMKAADNIVSKCPSITPDPVKASQLVTTRIQTTTDSDLSAKESSGPERPVMNHNHSSYPAAKFSSRTLPPNITNGPITESATEPKLNSKTTISDLATSNHKVPPPLPTLDLTSPNVTVANAVEKQPLKLIDTGVGVGARNSNYRTPINEKFAQKPVEMLASPSEGSPSKSYLNRLKNPIKTVSPRPAPTNNNNESLHDLNRSTQDSNTCECKGQEKKEQVSRGVSNIGRSAESAMTSLKQESFVGCRNMKTTCFLNSSVLPAYRSSVETDSNSDSKVNVHDVCSNQLMSSSFSDKNNDTTYNVAHPATKSLAINGVAGGAGATFVASTTKLEQSKRTPNTAAICNMSSVVLSSQQSPASFSLPCDNFSVQSQETGKSVSSNLINPKKRLSDETSAPLNSIPVHPLLPTADELASPQKSFQGDSNKSGEQRNGQVLFSSQSEQGEVAGAAAATNNAIRDEAKRNFFGPEKPRESLSERMNSDVALAANRIAAQLSKGDIPGPKIMTNAILKNRQQEMMAANAASTSPVKVYSRSSSGEDSIISNPTIIRVMLPGNGKVMPPPLTTTSIGICEPTDSPERKIETPRETIPLSSQQFQSDSRARPLHCVENTHTVNQGNVNGNVKRNVIAPSPSEIERCKAIGESNTESNSCAKGKVYANSPIVSGFGSERSRRRLLYDLKVRRDYPELFGITPRDRRSFIKQLGEHDGDSDNALVAPYYYHTKLSPLPLLKQLGLKSAIDSTSASSGAKAIQQLKQIPQEASKMIGMATTSICNKKGGIGEKLHSYLGVGNAKISPATSTTVSTSTSTTLSKNEFRQRLQLMESLDDDDDDASSSSSRPSESVRTSQKNSTNAILTARKDEGHGASLNSNKELEEGICEDSDDASLDEEGSRVMDLMMNDKSDGVLHHLHSHNHRRRSPEESSSNDSGISEEILILTDTHCSSHSKNMSSSMTEEASEDSVTASSQSATKPNEVISSAHNYTKCAPACVSSATSTNADRMQIHAHDPTNSINSCLADSSPPVRPVPASGLLRNYNEDVYGTGKSSSDRTSIPIGVSPNNNNNNAINHMNPKHNFSNVSTSTSTSCTSSPDVHTTFVSSMSPASPQIQRQIQAQPVHLTQALETRNSQHDPQLHTEPNPIDSPSAHSQTDQAGPGTADTVCSDMTSVLCKDDKTGVYDDSKMSPVCLSVKGETKIGMEAVVELASSPSPTKEKATMDKAIGTEDDDFIMDFSWIGRLPEKSYRTLMAERRDAFFHHAHPNSSAYPTPNCHPHTNGFMDSPPYNRHHPHHSYGYFYHHNNYSNSNPNSQRIKSNSSTITTVTSSSQPSSSSSYSCYLPPSSSNYFTGPESQAPTEPLLVKIYDGDALHCTDDLRETESPILKKPCERVMYTRLEQQSTAKVERVESSDDSTSSSSDLASASPAAENGTTDPSWSSSSSSLAGYSSSIKEEPSPSTSKCQTQTQSQSQGQSQSQLYQPLPSSSVSVNSSVHNNSSAGTSSVCNSHSNGYYSKSKSILMTTSFMDDGSSCSSRSRPEIVVTKESPELTRKLYRHSNSTDDEEDDDQATSNNSIVSNGWDKSRSSHSGGGKSEFLRVESNDSTAENYGDDDDYNFDDDDDEDLSHCSVATMNRYGTFESLEKIESEDNIGTMPEFTRNMPRSKARFTFDDDDDDDEEDLFEEDFESDFNFRFPTQIQDNTYSVSRLGPLPPLLEEDFEDDVYDEQRAGSESPNNANGERAAHPTSGNQVDQAGVRGDGYLLARIATMYARSSISPLKIFRELLMKKRYRQWTYKE